MVEICHQFKPAGQKFKPLPVLDQDGAALNAAPRVIFQQGAESPAIQDARKVYLRHDDTLR